MTVSEALREIGIQFDRGYASPANSEYIILKQWGVCISRLGHLCNIEFKCPLTKELEYEVNRMFTALYRLHIFKRKYRYYADRLFSVDDCVRPIFRTEDRPGQVYRLELEKQEARSELAADLEDLLEVL